MAIERLDEDIVLPFDEDAILSKNPQKLRDYLRSLIIALQDIQNRLITVANLSLDISDTDVYYFGSKNSSGEYPDSSWRFIKVGSDDFELQKKISGDWVKMSKWSE